MSKEEEREEGVFYGQVPERTERERRTAPSSTVFNQDQITT